jgi:hypothetical protein
MSLYLEEELRRMHVLAHELWAIEQTRPSLAGKFSALYRLIEGAIQEINIAKESLPSVVREDEIERRARLTENAVTWCVDTILSTVDKSPALKVVGDEEKAPYETPELRELGTFPGIDQAYEAGKAAGKAVRRLEMARRVFHNVWPALVAIAAVIALSAARTCEP